MLLLLSFMIMSYLTENQSVHQFELRALNAESSIKFEEFAGKKILIVNVASKCGYTRQYKDLEALYQQYQDKLVIVGVPCNQFGGQEPGTEAEIATFCSSTYGVSFPMTEKIDVKGESAHPLYQWLTQKSENGQGDYEIAWNFNKFLLDEEGKLISYYPSSVSPMDEKITSQLQ